MSTPSHQQLRSRIEAVYMEITRQAKSRGALSWFAEQAHVEPNTVYRWVNGESRPGGPVIGLLECMEREVGIE